MIGFITPIEKGSAFQKLCGFMYAAPPVLVYWRISTSCGQLGMSPYGRTVSVCISYVLPFLLVPPLVVDRNLLVHGSKVSRL